MIAPYYLLQNFLPNADQLRAGIDAHFSEPHRHGAQHQVWNYWFVPEAYTYLRTAPEKVIERALIEQFIARLKAHALDTLGMDTVTWPYLSLYVEGCGQTIHNDSRNGAFGFVYSLTRWDQRRFTGGETQIFREQDYWGSGRFREAGAGTSFYELIPSRYNQLLLFDDRLLHGVPMVRGTLDPREGRLVLHGHLSARGVSVRGALAPLGQNVAGLPELLQAIKQQTAAVRGRFHGFATFALDVAADGSVASVRMLVDRVLSGEGPGRAGGELKAASERMAQTRFPPSSGASRLDIPVFFE